MQRFKVIPESQLSEAYFDLFPVWSERYDYGEIEDIVQWGLDKEEVLRLFEVNSLGNEHCVYTLLESNPFPDRMRIFIRATLQAKTGVSLKGYVMNENAFCLGVFVSGKELIFSKHPLLEKDNAAHEKQLMELLVIKNDIFPITYKTDFLAKNEKVIAGEFMCRKNKHNMAVNFTPALRASVGRADARRSSLR